MSEPKQETTTGERPENLLSFLNDIRRRQLVVDAAEENDTELEEELDLPKQEEGATETLCFTSIIKKYNLKSFAFVNSVNQSSVVVPVTLEGVNDYLDVINLNLVFILPMYDFVNDVLLGLQVMITKELALVGVKTENVDSLKEWQAELVRCFIPHQIEQI